MYRFKSRATGDMLMLGPQGDLLLSLIGRQAAPQGIIEAADMPAAMAALQREAEEDDARRAGASQACADDARASHGGRDPVSLRQRIWPMVEMMRRSSQAGEPIVWGV